MTASYDDREKFSRIRALLSQRKLVTPEEYAWYRANQKAIKQSNSGGLTNRPWPRHGVNRNPAHVEAVKRHGRTMEAK